MRRFRPRYEAFAPEAALDASTLASSDCFTDAPSPDASRASQLRPVLSSELVGAPAALPLVEPPETEERAGEQPLVSGAWVVVPTYNERDNLREFVEVVLSYLAAASLEYRVLIVDDSSPDGTGELADELADEYPAVRVLHRPVKDGLGRAYVAGFREALAGGAEFILEMDADFSHDPADIPRLIAATTDADVVLGSRYVAGGDVVNWQRRRRLVSRGGCWYARSVLGTALTDLTGGFKCFRRAVLEAIDLNKVVADGFSFQIELTYRALVAGFKVREVPILFHERRAGQSKMSLRIAMEAMWKVPALRLAVAPGQVERVELLQPVAVHEALVAQAGLGPQNGEIIRESGLVVQHTGEALDD